MKNLNKIKIIYLLLSQLKYLTGILINKYLNKLKKCSIWFTYISKNKKGYLYTTNITSYKLRYEKFSLPNYDPWIRPVVNERTTTNITLNLSLLQLLEIVSHYEISKLILVNKTQFL